MKPEYVFGATSVASGVGSYYAFNTYMDARKATQEVWDTPRPENMDPYEHLVHLISKSQEHELEWVLGATAFVSLGVMAAFFASVAIAIAVSRKR